MTDPSYTIADTLTFSRAKPGRFNTQTFGALYMVVDPDTALAELIRRAHLVNRRPAHFHPRALFTYDVRLQNVLDLTSDTTLMAWGLDHSIIASDAHAACQEVAAAAHRDGYEAIRYPSVTGRGDNMAVYYEVRHPGSYVEEVGRASIDLDSL